MLDGGGQRLLTTEAQRHGENKVKNQNLESTEMAEVTEDFRIRAPARSRPLSVSRCLGGEQVTCTKVPLAGAGEMRDGGGVQDSGAGAFPTFLCVSVLLW